MDSQPAITALLNQILLAEELDLLHLSLVNLSDMSRDGDIDIFLEQPKKSAKQKMLYLQKVIDSLPSPLFRTMLQEVLDGGDFDFFGRKRLQDFIKQVQNQAEAITIVHLTVSTKFKEPELREMAKIVEGKLKCQVVFNLKVDRSLIGGAVIQYGSYITDYSIKTRLDQFRASWHRAAIE